jgi:hypothetical protein
MVEYALLSAGNALGSLQLFAGRVAGSIGAVELALIVAGAWLAWRILDRLVGPRRG